MPALEITPSTARPLRAVSIRQPWADAIIFGNKRTENRTWALPRSAVGTILLIHASKSADRGALPTPMTDRWPDDRGALIGYARFPSSHHASTHCCTPWGEPHAWHWTLTDVHPLPTPVPCPGSLGLWTPPPTALQAITALTQNNL
uniref:ASCH domain-containing protein n=1 Tax=Streptomyces sp. NBC_00008 TaxID=2903610 RepID=A0AAU2VRD1_9ACTN